MDRNTYYNGRGNNHPQNDVYENSIIPPLSDEYPHILSQNLTDLGPSVRTNHPRDGYLYISTPLTQHNVLAGPGFNGWKPPHQGEFRARPMTAPSEYSDNVFISRTNSSNPISFSDSNYHITGLSPPLDATYATFSTQSNTFHQTDSNMISTDGIHTRNTQIYARHVPTTGNHLVMNGSFGNSGIESNLPPCLHCPIMMLKTENEIASRLNNSSSPPAICRTQPNNDPNQLLNLRRHQHPEANIRQADKRRLKLLLRAGNIIQVSGPPMAGKSTLVRQAINEMIDEHQVSIIQHHFICKGLNSLDDLLAVAVQKLCPQLILPRFLDEEMAISHINTQLSKQSGFCHALVFHKCESFLLQENGHRFIDFLSRLSMGLTRSMLNVTVIFTTYKRFSPRGSMMETLEVDALTDIWDVLSILQFYTSHVEVLNYAHICLRHLCLPEAVRLVAEKFIASEELRVPAEELEKKIFKDTEFLSSIFDSRLREVPEWIPQNILMSIVHFSHSIDSSFTQEHLQNVSSDQNPYEWQKIIQYLKHNYIIRSFPGINRMAVHPLVVHYCKTAINEGKLVLRGQWFDHSCNRYTNFLCRILINTEANIRLQGRKGLVYGGLIQEWPNVRYLIERALHCNMNTYEAFLKVSVSANGLIMKCFAKEAREFYSSLFACASEYGTQTERAVLEALLGNALSVSSAPANEDEAALCCVEYELAKKHLSSAIKLLYKEGPSYQLVWALGRKGIVLHRQGKYQESLQCFAEARCVLRSLNKHALGEMFSVSDLQVEEERITQEIHETIPVIFTGNNQLARERLKLLLEHINYRCENHPELSTLLNLIGLTEQRGNNDLDSAIKWYRLSYNERMYLYKVNPENLLAVLNNIAMILLEKGELDQCIKYLNQALEIRRECGWRHYYTALTLTHLSEVYMKCHNFPEAYKKALEAEKILKLTTKQHDMRLRINLTLAHIRVVLRQIMDSESAKEESLGSPFEPCNRNNGGSVPCQEHEENVPIFEALITNFNFSAPEDPSFSSNASYDQSCRLKGNYLTHTAPQYAGLGGAPAFPFQAVGSIDIEAADLSNTAKDFLELSLNIFKDSSTLSDDGHKNCLAAYTHAMVLNWGDDERRAQYKEAILEYIKSNPDIESTIFKSPVSLNSRYELLRQQAPLYYYIKDTPVENLNLPRFLQLMVSSCHICAYVRNVYTQEMWSREVQYLMFTRREKERFLQELDKMRVDLHISSIPDLDPQSSQTCAANVSFKSQALQSDSNKEANELPDFSKIMANSTDFEASSLATIAMTYPEVAHSGVDNLCEQLHSADNNLSQPVESPKVIQDQRILLDRFAQREKTDCKPLEFGAVGGFNITNADADYNLVESGIHEKKGSLGSKVIANNREPVEQSEFDQLGHPYRSINDPYMHSMGQYGHYKHSANQQNPLSGQQSVIINLETTSKMALQLALSPVEPSDIHQSSLYPKTQRSQVTQSSDPTPNHESLSKSHEDSYSKCQFVQQLIMDPSLISPFPETGGSTYTSASMKGISQAEISSSLGAAGARAHSGINLSISGVGSSSISDPHEGQRASMTESGFAGSLFGSSLDYPHSEICDSQPGVGDLQQHAQTHNLMSNMSNVTDESGYLSRGAKPKTPQHCVPLLTSWSSDSDTAPSFLESKPDLSSYQPRGPTEDSEFSICVSYSYSDCREPDEDSWCDTITNSNTTLTPRCGSKTNDSNSYHRSDSKLSDKDSSHDNSK